MANQPTNRDHRFPATRVAMIAGLEQIRTALSNPEITQQEAKDLYSAFQALDRSGSVQDILTPPDGDLSQRIKFFHFWTDSMNAIGSLKPSLAKRGYAPGASERFRNEGLEAVNGFIAFLRGLDDGS